MRNGLVLMLLCVLPFMGCASSRSARFAILSQSRETLTIYKQDDEGVYQSVRIIRVTRLSDTCTPGVSSRVNCPSSADESCKDEGCVHTGECFCGVENPDDAVGHIYAICDCGDKAVEPLGDIQVIMQP
jgi:hypothetical protein